MTSKKILSLWGLKWNPFSPDLPTDALLVTGKIDAFAWRVEHLVREGGFAMITGESGTGKSVALRIVAQRLSLLRDVVVGVLERPQSKNADFYRELGDIFSVKLSPSNRWGGFRALRERWKTHVAASRIKPVLLVDEAQEMEPDVLNELRILSSAEFDATSLLTVVLAGDGRLPDLLRQEDLIPLGTRIRTRLMMEPATRDELRAAHARAGQGRQRVADDFGTDRHAGRAQCRQLSAADDDERRTAGAGDGPRGRAARREVLPGGLPSDAAAVRGETESEGVRHGYHRS
jgi:general secretion pathway protein A